jgi:pimeloyl-ACP methyl ester carboxylesterase
VPTARLGAVALEYTDHGGGSATPLLMVMGLGMPAAAWPSALIEQLAASRRVISFDNRDIGGSSRWPERARLPIQTAMLRALLRRPVPAPYTLDDMAADTAALLDHLGLARVHLLGVSMGGMIAQQLAARWPQRVASLTSIMSGTGRMSMAQIARPRALRAILSRRADPADLDAVLARLEYVYGAIGSPAAAHDLEGRRSHLRRIAGSGLDADGSRRQLLAILAAGDRRASLARISAPTLVLHGSLDPLVPPAAGRDTAACIRDSRFVLIDGLGHDLPARFIGRIAGEINTHLIANEPVTSA